MAEAAIAGITKLLDIAVRYDPGGYSVTVGHTLVVDAVNRANARRALLNLMVTNSQARRLLAEAGPPARKRVRRTQDAT